MLNNFIIKLIKKYYIQIWKNNICYTNIIAIKIVIISNEVIKKTVNNEKTNKIKLAKIWKILILINFNCKYK